jgi:hypothetical protein
MRHQFRLAEPIAAWAQGGDARQHQRHQNQCRDPLGSSCDTGLAMLEKSEKMPLQSNQLCLHQAVISWYRSRLAERNLIGELPSRSELRLGSLERNDLGARIVVILTFDRSKLKAGRWLISKPLFQNHISQPFGPKIFSSFWRGRTGGNTKAFFFSFSRSEPVGFRVVVCCQRFPEDGGGVTVGSDVGLGAAATGAPAAVLMRLQVTICPARFVQTAVSLFEK